VLRGELRKVAWPTKSETINYSIIVFVAVVILTTYISSVDYAFGELVLRLFQR
jgi:preprotein translocase subunit SecE